MSLMSRFSLGGFLGVHTRTHLGMFKTGGFLGTPPQHGKPLTSITPENSIRTTQRQNTWEHCVLCSLNQFYTPAWKGQLSLSFAGVIYIYTYLLTKRWIPIPHGQLVSDLQWPREQRTCIFRLIDLEGTPSENKETWAPPDVWIITLQSPSVFQNYNCPTLTWC